MERHRIVKNKFKSGKNRNLATIFRTRVSNHQKVEILTRVVFLFWEQSRQQFIIRNRKL